jgi:multiple sugar transport system substrate-binding protein
MSLSGLTWDHPRGRQALRAAAARDPALGLAWDVQPLEGFESAPIADLAARYDLLVLDHPHLGEAVAAGCLRPLDALFPPTFLDALARDAMGPALRSYVYGGRPWALPLDAATQVAVAQPRLLAEAPATWPEVLDLPAEVPVALCLAGPHALLHLLALAVALGEEPAARDPDTLLSQATGRAALELLAALHARRARGVDGLNPIGILEAMAAGAPIALCPLVYGYVPYARVLRFADAPAAAPGGRPGSVLGGTGIAVTTRCDPTPALLAHLRWLMSRDVQAGFIPAESGQPGLRAAWEDPDVNAAWGDFYRRTARTLDAAWVRPRHPGWIAFQTEAAALLRAALDDRASPAVTLGRLQDLYAISRRGGGEL